MVIHNNKTSSFNLGLDKIVDDLYSVVLNQSAEWFQLSKSHVQIFLQFEFLVKK